ncbi:hypothetical protein [Zooshikella ganghwensis]|uniref:Uncharacterized protein n=1 Tax=Zooshikella ganghwensis TaxID=202772 RepID=A0A4P9VJG4_9GAMM|nr:hypothetical protein [Zooshikella ganghwensis]RDH42746.1 hypothetical protein B9G39_04375 [Zooshikella ganghwensis]
MKPRELILISDCDEERRQQTLKLIREGYKPLNSEEGYIRFGSLNIQRTGAMKQLESSDRLAYAHLLPLTGLRAEHIEMTEDNT